MTTTTAPSTWTTDLHAWQERARANSDRADKIGKTIRERARRLSAEAGLDPNLLGIHPHNAMGSYDAGKPWKGVDYAKVRKVLHLVERSFVPRRVAERVNNRLWNSMLADKHGCARSTEV